MAFERLFEKSFLETSAKGLPLGAAMAHTRDMTTTTAPRWCRSSCPCGRERGSVDRAQMRTYALAVAVALVGRAACVHCTAPVSLHDGEVDRTVEGVCYAPGGVVMVCRACNNARNTEALDTERYAADVLAASEGIAVPSGSAAMRAYRASGDEGQLSRSPYAV